MQEEHHVRQAWSDRILHAAYNSLSVLEVSFDGCGVRKDGRKKGESCRVGQRVAGNVRIVESIKRVMKSRM